MKRAFILFTALVALSACGGKGAVAPNGPEWLDGTSAKYPNAQFVVGTGTGQSLDEAKDRARAEVAKVFEVVINDISQENMKYVSNAEGEALTQEVARNTTTRTDKVLRGVEIADTWMDPQSHQYYALATLNRARSARALRQEVEALDNDTRTFIRKARNSNDALDKVANAYAALSRQMERSGLQRSLQVVDNSGQGVPPEWSLAELSTDLREQMARIRMTTRVSGPEGFADQVNGALGKAGFLVKPGEVPDFTLSASLRLGEPAQRDGWYWVNARMEILLSNAQARIRGSKRWDIKVSATVADLANKRAMDKASSILQDELRTTLLGFAKE